MNTIQFNRQKYSPLGTGITITSMAQKFLKIKYDWGSLRTNDYWINQI